MESALTPSQPLATMAVIELPSARADDPQRQHELMSPKHDTPRPGTLWPAVLASTERALEAGALEPFQTEQAVLDDAGVSFLVRRVSSLERKIADARRPKSDGAGNPFLPYDRQMFVADISQSHVALLNKYPVLEHHLLLVTRAYHSQVAMLDHSDFEALWIAMMEYPSLGFYNGGPAAGASQPHKHLQVVPLPLSADGAAIPVESLLDSVPRSETPGCVPTLEFPHAFTWLDPASLGLPTTAAPYLLGRYRALLAMLEIGAEQHHGETRQSMAYNLLITRRWMLAVPRTRERYDSIFVNALGFAGSFFVRKQQQMDLLRGLGPMHVLARVCGGAD